MVCLYKIGDTSTEEEGNDNKKKKHKTKKKEKKKKKKEEINEEEKKRKRKEKYLCDKLILHNGTNFHFNHLMVKYGDEKKDIKAFG